MDVLIKQGAPTVGTALIPTCNAQHKASKHTRMAVCQKKGGDHNKYNYIEKMRSTSFKMAYTRHNKRVLKT